MPEKLSEEMRSTFDRVRRNYEAINEAIAQAAGQSGRRPEDITFLAATKTVPPEVINYAISLGLRHIGENKVQELLSKYDDYQLSDCDLQFIGHLQTNKVRQLIGKVSMIQSVDSLRLAQEIDKQSEKNGLTTDILVEVNIGRETNKSGVLTETLDELLAQMGTLSHIKVRGLMTVPPICDKKTDVFKFFDQMRQLFIDISAKTLDNVSMDFLSMGMSDDFAEAIRSGANMVRIGSALFGARIYR